MWYPGNDKVYVAFIDPLIPQALARPYTLLTRAEVLRQPGLPPTDYGPGPDQLRRYRGRKARQVQSGGR